MRILLFTILCLSIFFFFLKDYPSDIPDWLKTRIDKCKYGKCCSSGISSVDEYINNANQNKIYKISDHNISMASKYYYDFDGNTVCIYNSHFNINSDSCGSIKLSELKYTRNVWHVEQKKCHD